MQPEKRAEASPDTILGACHIKEVFALYTCGQDRASYTKDIKALVERKHGTYLGEYGCLGFDTFGPFKLVGGLQKGHPTEEEIEGL